MALLWFAKTRFLDRARIVAASWVFHLFLSGIIMLVVFMHPPELFQGDFDTALNYLNTIVSSLSTILALCISIILVAIQLTASNYTHRVLDYFVRLPYNASLFSFYLVTIMRSFFLMSYIRDDPDFGPKTTRIPATLWGLQPISSNLDRAMSADLIMVAICFVSLLVYMYAVIQLLKPERIITLVLRDYDRAIVTARFRAALDNVEQICDIAKRAASFSDSLTGARCVDVMTKLAARLPLPKDTEDPLLQIHRGVVDQWVEMAGVAVKERETGLLKSVIDALYNQGVVYMEGKSFVAAELVVTTYRHLLFAHLLSDNQVFYVDRICTKMYQLAYVAASHGQRGQLFCLRTWEMISHIGACTFPSHPGSSVQLMDGLLLVPEVKDTFSLLSPVARKRALVTYFGLWQTFAEFAALRDVVRWARWWGDSETTVTAFGQSLALCLLKNGKRKEWFLSLQEVFGVTQQSWDCDRVMNEMAPDAGSLFDGMPRVLPTHKKPDRGASPLRGTLRRRGSRSSGV